MNYKILMSSEEYGAEYFGPYDTLVEAYEALGRLAQGCVEHPDDVCREFTVMEAYEEPPTIDEEHAEREARQGDALLDREKGEP